jgi:hypothetical protein
VGGVVLLIVGGGGVYLGYAKYLVKTAPVVLAPVISSPIFVDETVRLSAGTSDALLSEIQQSIANPPALSSVRLLYTDLATTTGNDVFSRLQFSAPAVLLRNIKSRESMAGIVNMAGTPSPFFILSVTSYPDTFGGMLSWEPRMPEDISALFPSFAPTPPPVMQVSVLATTSTTTTATTTSKQSNVTSSKTKGKVIQKVATSTPPVPLPPLPPRPAFHDEVISNHDVRVYRDSEGRSVFMYGYWDKTTLVIARDVVAFTEILRRLSTSLSR